MQRERVDLQFKCKSHKGICANQEWMYLPSAYAMRIPVLVLALPEVNLRVAVFESEWNMTGLM